MKNFSNKTPAQSLRHIRSALTILSIAAFTLMMTACAPQDDLNRGSRQDQPPSGETSDKKSGDQKDTKNAEKKQNERKVASAKPAPQVSQPSTTTKPAIAVTKPAITLPKQEVRENPKSNSNFAGPATSDTALHKEVPQAIPQAAPVPPIISQPVLTKSAAPKVTATTAKEKPLESKQAALHQNPPPEPARTTNQRDTNARFDLPYNPELYALGKQAQQNMSIVCAKKPERVVKVTHYFLPLLSKFDAQHCHWIEGVCRFQKNGVEYIYNYTGGNPQPHKAVPLASANCKSGIGYGRQTNCTHPCRSLAAWTGAHRDGEVIFFKNLVGLKCGSGKNAMIHDGFMVVNDTGAISKFHQKGRFDFYWGGCKKIKGSNCKEGGSDIELALTGSKKYPSSYCQVWTNQAAKVNADLKLKVFAAVREEAIIKNDDANAKKYNFTEWVSLKNRATRL